MAETFKIRSSSYKGRYLELSCKQTPNVEKNTSEIRWTLIATGGSSAYYSTGPTTAKVGGNQVYYCARKAYSTHAFPAAAGSTGGTITVQHEDDGTCTIPVSLTTAIYVAGDSAATVNGNWTLDPIPRASTVTATDANIGSVSTVVVNRKNTGFSHVLKVSFGGLTGYINGEGNFVSDSVKLTKTTISFKITESFYGKIPTKASDTCTITCTTYAGETVIGTKTTTFTVTADKRLCAPSVTIGVKDVNETTLALTGDEKKLVRYHSTARCTASATAKNGATVKEIKVEGKAVTNGIADFSAVEKNSFTATCTDSRGYTNQATATATLIPYVLLTCNASGKRLTPTGGDARVTVQGNYYNGSFGAANNALTLSYNLEGQTYEVVPQIAGNTYSAQIDLEELDYTKSYTVIVTAKDALRTLQKTVKIHPGIPVFDWGERDVSFHVPVKFQDVTMTDFVVEQGEVDTWAYRKWNSGLGECWYRKQFTANVTTPIGSLYTTGAVADTDAKFPFSFKVLPSITATLTCVGDGGFLSPVGQLTLDRTGAYEILRPNAVQNATFRICYHAVGRWK